MCCWRRLVFVTWAYTYLCLFVLCNSVRNVYLKCGHAFNLVGPLMNIFQLCTTNWHIIVLARWTCQSLAASINLRHWQTFRFNVTVDCASSALPIRQTAALRLAKKHVHNSMYFRPFLIGFRGCWQFPILCFSSDHTRRSSFSVPVWVFNSRQYPQQYCISRDILLHVPDADYFLRCSAQYWQILSCLRTSPISLDHSN
jgi:hypothetical protein